MFQVSSVKSSLFSFNMHSIFSLTSCILKYKLELFVNKEFRGVLLQAVPYK